MWPWRKPQRPDWRIVFYTRQGCHLCDDAKTLVEALQAEYGFTVEIQDIDGDPQLREKFTTCVPVVEVNGKVRFRGQVNAVLFRRLLNASSSE